MKAKTLIVLFLLIKTAIAQNVFLVVIDGARYTETFGAANPIEFIPRMWSDLKPLGTVYTNFWNTGYTSTNPGHAALLTGTWQTISNDGSERPTKPTVFEYFRKEKSALPNKVFVISGKEKLNILNYSTDEQYGSPFMASALAENLTDNEVYDSLVVIMDMYRPKLVIVNLPSVDLAGHSNNWEGYLSAIRNADNLVHELWNKIQSDSHYKNNTTLFITNDHGRHTNDFKSHGDNCVGCEHIMLLALGRNIPKANIISTMRDQTNIASSVGDLLLFDTPQATGSSLFNDSTDKSIKINIKVFLEGPFSSGTMTTFIEDRLPRIQNIYEETGVFTKTAENVSVDTVLVELRIDKNIPSDIIKKASLLNTGSIVDLDGISPLSFNIIPGSYYIVVRHRNHLPIMSNDAVVFPE